MRNLKTLEWVALILIIIGAVNWGFVGLFGFNLVEALFGAATILTNIIYILIGIAGYYEIFVIFFARRKVIRKGEL